MSLTKNPHPQPKKFFWVQTRRLATSFDASTTSIALTEQEKFLCKTTCVSVFFRKSPKAAGRQSVNIFQLKLIATFILMAHVFLHCIGSGQHFLVYIVQAMPENSATLIIKSLTQCLLTVSVSWPRLMIRLKVLTPLTRIELAYRIFVVWFRPKKLQFSVALPTP